MQVTHKTEAEHDRGGACFWDMEEQNCVQKLALARRECFKNVVSSATPILAAVCRPATTPDNHHRQPRRIFCLLIIYPCSSTSCPPHRSSCERPQARTVATATTDVVGRSSRSRTKLLSSRATTAIHWCSHDYDSAVAGPLLLLVRMPLHEQHPVLPSSRG